MINVLRLPYNVSIHTAWNKLILKRISIWIFHAQWNNDKKTTWPNAKNIPMAHISPSHAEVETPAQKNKEFMPTSSISSIVTFHVSFANTVLPLTSYLPLCKLMLHSPAALRVCVHWTNPNQASASASSTSAQGSGQRMFLANLNWFLLKANDATGYRQDHYKT